MIRFYFFFSMSGLSQLLYNFQKGNAESADLIEEVSLF